MSDAYSDFETDERDLLEALRRRSQGKPVADRCPDPRLVLAAAEAVLDEHERAGIDAHVAACASCRLLKESMAEAGLPGVSDRQVDRVLSRVRRELPASGFASRRWGDWRWWTLRLVPVAAAVVVIVTVGFLRRWGGPVDQPAATAPSLPPPEPVVDLAALVPLEAPPVELPVDAVLVWRDSGADPRAAYLKGLAEALVPYKNKDYERAAVGLERVVASHPDAPQANFYLGVCLVLLDRPEQAMRYLAKVNLFAGTPWERKAAWYLGIASLRSGDAASALEEFRRLCKGEGERKTEACAAAKQLEQAVVGPARR